MAQSSPQEVGALGRGPWMASGERHPWRRSFFRFIFAATAAEQKGQGRMGLFRKLPIHVGREREEFFVKPVETFGSRMDAQDLICAPACHVHRICSKNINVLVSSNMKHNMPKQYVYACMIIKQKICS
jgi:hypothetical protein